MTDFISRDLEGFELVNKLTECNELFTKLKHKYGEEFCNNLPLDKKILSYFNRKHPKEKKTGVEKTGVEKTDKKREKTYGKDSNNHGLPWGNKDKLILHDMFEQDKTVEEIAEYLGRTDYSIECMLLHEGMTDATMDANSNDIYYIKTSDKTKKSWSIREVKRLLEYYNNDVSTEVIAEKLTLSSNLRSKNNKLTEDDVIDKLEQLGLVEVEDVIED